MARRWRNWAFESAALDLALNQAGRSLHDAIGRQPRAVRFVNSLGLGDPPGFDPIRRRLERHPGLRFKLDATAAWTPSLIDESPPPARSRSSTSRATTGSTSASCRRSSRCTSAPSPRSPTRCSRMRTTCRESRRCSSRRWAGSPTTRRSGAVADLDATPLPPRAVNIKPCRVGDLRSLFDLYAACDARGLITYGGGMGELGVGREQIQLLAALFHADAPNDVAPGGYNADTPAADLPPSPLPAGRRRRASAGRSERRLRDGASAADRLIHAGWRSSTQCTCSGLGSTLGRSRLTTTGSWPLRTSTHDSGSSSLALISWCGT